MKTVLSRGTLWLVTLAALGTALVATMKADALHKRFASPTPVAVVDWLKVTDKSKEWRDMQASLRSITETLLEEEADWQKKLSEMKEGIAALPPATGVRRQEEEQYVLKDLQFQAWKQFRQAKMQTEQARLQVRLYLRINDAIEKVARRDGWSIVLWNDSDVSKINEGNLEASAELMSRRRAFYADVNTVDITDEVVVLMNNEFDAGAGDSSSRTEP